MHKENNMDVAVKTEFQVSNEEMKQDSKPGDSKSSGSSKSYDDSEMSEENGSGKVKNYPCKFEGCNKVLHRKCGLERHH